MVSLGVPSGRDAAITTAGSTAGLPRLPSTVVWSESSR